MTKIEQYGLSKSEWNHLIDEWVIGRNAERDREILRQKLVMGSTFCELAELFDLSHQRVEQIVYGRVRALLPHIERLRKT